MSTPQTEKARQVLDAIVQAFPATPLDPTRAFDGRGETSLDAESFAGEARGKTWRALDPQFLERHREVPLFLGAPAFAEYLPAFLAAAVEHHRELDLLPDFVLSAVRRPSEPPADVARFDTWASTLTAPQARAVAESVLYLEPVYGEAGPANPATLALESYWRGRLVAPAAR